MIVENPLALPFIFTDGVYVLQREKALFNNAPQQPEAAEPVPATVMETPVITFNYTGGYQKKFLVLVHYSGHEAMDPAHLAALESTIKRKELSLDDLAILNISKQADITFESISRFFKPRKMLVLGESALPAGLTPPLLNQLKNQADCDTLYSFSFAEMMGNKENTKAFWEQMKNL